MNEGALDSATQRRARLVRRHRVDGTAGSAHEAAEAVVALHATDPATVYLSAMARSARLTVAEIARELYDACTLVRMLAMRRTLFVAPLATAPVLHHAAALDVAANIRKSLLKQLRTLPTEPELPADLEEWLVDVERAVERALAELHVASGAQLSKAEPRLKTALLPTTDKAYDVRRAVTTQVLTLMGAEGRIVRGRPLGSWTSRQHTWEPATSRWPDGMPAIGKDDARVRLVELYLRRFGPATEADVAWWTGWGLGVTRTALATLDLVAVGDGLLVLADDTDRVAVPEETAALLPALDPTPMGWQQRDWYLPEDRAPLFDRMGNVGPTIWWAGEVVGGWAVRPAGAVATRLLVDRGAQAAAAVARAAERLQERLDGAVVVPSFPTPLERALRAG